MRYAHKVLTWKPEGKRPLGRPRRRWEYNIRMDLREIGWLDVDWMQMADSRDQLWVPMNTVMNPLGSKKEG